MSMMPSYLIDSNVLITAKNKYYAFRICPGFWDSILHNHSLGHVHSIDEVREELLRGRGDDDLVQWVNYSVPADFFLDSEVEKIKTAFEKVMLWVDCQKQYSDEAKDKFSEGADGWLVAHGITDGKTVVSNEESSPKSQRKVKLPDVCNAFSVDFKDPFAMLHMLGVQYSFGSVF